MPETIARIESVGNNSDPYNPDLVVATFYDSKYDVGTCKKSGTEIDGGKFDVLSYSFTSGLTALNDEYWLTTTDFNSATL